jgi:hypothetical protein
MRQCAGMTPELTPHNETANNSDDSGADGIEGDHAGELICGKEIRRIASEHAATVPG